MQEARLAAVVEEKALKVLPQQKQVRSAIAMERWVWGKARPTRLLEFTRWRRCAPQDLAPDALSLPPPAWLPPGPLMTKEAETALLRIPSAACRMCCPPFLPLLRLHLHSFLPSSVSIPSLPYCLVGLFHLSCLAFLCSHFAVPCLLASLGQSLQWRQGRRRLRLGHRAA